ncbi:putative toxin-antitoxin system toxin component, PIN family [Mariprofundus ferrooxydans]|nr:putative toxin-antitoxin system toxin component, PIN family [Mariprofundus ferrooxydans]MBN4076719.1 putative toxin-antitoxin system toxin component, PIN family [Mariprofundus ferrooxydans]
MNRRLVFDTNTIVSALLFEQGRLAWLRPFWQAGKHQPLASRATIQELIRVLAYPKFKLNEPQIQALLADYLPYVESVDIPECMPTLPQCRDKKDQMFIELATIGAADVLITGDADLLAMVEVCPFSILSPADFYAEMHGI